MIESADTAVREWWIFPEEDKRYVFEEKPISSADLLHVIEYSAYAEAVARIKELMGQINDGPSARELSDCREASQIKEDQAFKFKAERDKLQSRNAQLVGALVGYDKAFACFDPEDQLSRSEMRKAIIKARKALAESDSRESSI